MTKKKLVAAAAMALAMMLATSAPVMAQEVDFDVNDSDDKDSDGNDFDGGDVDIVVVDDFDRNDRRDDRNKNNARR